MGYADLFEGRTARSGVSVAVTSCSPMSEDEATTLPPRPPAPPGGALPLLHDGQDLEGVIPIPGDEYVARPVRGGQSHDHRIGVRVLDVDGVPGAVVDEEGEDLLAAGLGGGGEGFSGVMGVVSVIMGSAPAGPRPMNRPKNPRSWTDGSRT